jgi:hypothetical protein
VNSPLRVAGCSPVGFRSGPGPRGEPAAGGSEDAFVAGQHLGRPEVAAAGADMGLVEAGPPGPRYPAVDEGPRRAAQAG